MTRYATDLLTDPPPITHLTFLALSCSNYTKLWSSFQPGSTMAASNASSQQPEDPKVPVIDMDTFEQILELDEDDTRDFSAEMVWQYFDQAKLTFTDMDAAL